MNGWATRKIGDNTDFEIISTCEAYDEINKDEKVISDFSKSRLISAMEKDANPTIMRRINSNGKTIFTPV